MKSVNRLFVAAVLAVALTSSAFAGECCTKAAAAAKAGKTCEKCTKGACCKETVKDLTAKGEAKTCEKCAAKK